MSDGDFAVEIAMTGGVAISALVETDEEVRLPRRLIHGECIDVVSGDYPGRAFVDIPRRKL